MRFVRVFAYSKRMEDDVADGHAVLWRLCGWPHQWHGWRSRRRQATSYCHVRPNRRVCCCSTRHRQTCYAVATVNAYVQNDRAELKRISMLLSSHWFSLFLVADLRFSREDGWKYFALYFFSFSSLLRFFLSFPFFRFSVNTITHEPLHLARWNFARKWILSIFRILLNFRVIGQRSRSHGSFMFCVHATAATADST